MSLSSRVLRLSYIFKVLFLKRWRETFWQAVAVKRMKVAPVSCSFDASSSSTKKDIHTSPRRFINRMFTVNRWKENNYKHKELKRKQSK